MHDSRSRWRAMPGAGVAEIDDRRACTHVIQSPSRLHRSERAIRARINSYSVSSTQSYQDNQRGRRTFLLLGLE